MQAFLERDKAQQLYLGASGLEFADAVRQRCNGG